MIHDAQRDRVTGLWKLVPLAFGVAVATSAGWTLAQHWWGGCR